MKRLGKLLITALGLFALTGCGAASIIAKVASLEPSYAAHSHEWSEGYAADEHSHWHVATCEHNVISAKEEHEFGSWKKVRNATPIKEGLERRRCSVCRYEETREIPKVFYIQTSDIFILNNAPTELIVTATLLNDSKTIHTGDEYYLYCRDGSLETFRVDKIQVSRVDYDSLTYEQAKDGFAIIMDCGTNEDAVALKNKIVRLSFLSDRDDLVIPKIRDEEHDTYTYVKVKGYLDMLTGEEGGRRTSIPFSETNPYSPQLKAVLGGGDFTADLYPGESGVNIINPGDDVRVVIQPKYNDTYAGSIYLYLGQVFRITEGGRLIGYLVITQDALSD